MLNFLRKLIGGTSADDRTSSGAASEARPSTGALKYYVYISQTKVDMLFPQVPADFLKGAEAEVKVDLGIASAGLKSRGPEEAKELPGRAAVVSAFIKKHDDVGDVSDPKRWIAGSAKLQWGVVAEYASDIVFFGGTIGGKRLALLGSRESLVGEAKTSQANHQPFYYTLKFFNEIAERDEDEIVEDKQPPYYSYRRAIDIALEALPQRTTNVEFLAKVLHSEPDCLVASPLYVAILD